MNTTTFSDILKVETLFKKVKRLSWEINQINLQNPIDSESTDYDKLHELQLQKLEELAVLAGEITILRSALKRAKETV